MGKNKKRQRQEKVHKVEAKESQSCKESSSDGAPTMTVKSGTKVENVLKFSRKTLEEGKHRKIFWTGNGKAITRTISCAETLKRHFQLHQVTEISQESAQEGAGKVTYIPSIRILQSLDKIDPSTPG
uniref:DNA/RNA-binding protein Alba-like domain-containing protein n=2 Tax=Phlebotomus papatasi TaxID=29031 RepID=A0A1B0D9Z0_PHLPP